MVGLLPNLEASIPALRRYAQILLVDLPDADEVVRVSLAAALERPHAMRDGPGLQVWLLGLVHRNSLRRLRRKGVQWQTSSPNVRRNEVPGTEGDDAGTDATIPMFVRLPVELRSVLMLVCVEGLRYPAVAEVLDVPVATVMSLLAEGRQQLRYLAGETASDAARRSA